MDDPVVVAVVCVLGAIACGVLAYGGHVYRRLSAIVGPSSWNEAVRTVADQLGLEHTSVPTAHDRVEGHVARQSVTLWHTSSTATLGGIAMELAVFTSNVPESLSMRAVGARWDRHPERARGPRQRTGDADFDACVEVYGAPEPFFVILRDDPALRALVARAIAGTGATLDDRHLRVVRARFASSAEEIRAALDPMIELGQALERPLPRGQTRGVGTPLAIAIRRAERLEGAAKGKALTQALSTIAPKLGDASVETTGDRGEIALRGQVDGHAVHIAIDGSLGVKLTVEAVGQRDRLWLNLDRTPFDTAAAKPPRPGDDPALPIYVGEQVYVEGRRAKREAMRAAFDALPSDVREALITQMPLHHIRYFRIRDDEVWLMFWSDLDEMIDPEQDLVAALTLAVRVAGA